MPLLPYRREVASPGPQNRKLHLKRNKLAEQEWADLTKFSNITLKQLPANPRNFSKFRKLRQTRTVRKKNVRKWCGW